MAPPGSAGLTTRGAFFISLKVKGASMRPCLKNIGRIRHALHFRPLFSEPRANFVVTRI